MVKTMSRELKTNPALNFIRDDERELGDTGNLLTLPEWHALIPLPFRKILNRQKLQRQSFDEELLSSGSSHHPTTMQGSWMDLFACVFIGINLCYVLYSVLDYLSRCLDH